MSEQCSFGNQSSRLSLRAVTVRHVNCAEVMARAALDELNVEAGFVVFAACRVTQHQEV